MGSSGNKSSSQPPLSFSDENYVVQLSPSFPRHNDREKPGRQSSSRSWLGGLNWGRGEVRNTKQVERPKHKRSQKSKHGSADPTAKGPNQRDLSPSFGQPIEIERRDFSDNENPQTGSDLASSYSADSMVSIPSDDFPSRLQELGRRVNEEDRDLLKKVARYIQDKDREMRKAVTTIAKMHRTDGQKRGDIYFIKLTKTLRVLIENWSMTQNIFFPSSKSGIKTIFAELFNTSSSSTHLETLRSIGPNYTQYLARTEDIPRLMQAYLWAVLEREIFGRYQWAGDTKTYIDLKAAVSPPNSTSSIGVIQARQYHEWRAMTARLADQNMTNERLTAKSEQIGYRAVEPLYQNHDKRSTDTVVEIVRRALELDVEMSKQKALFYFSYLGCPFHYDHEKMAMAGDHDNGSSVARGSWDVDLFLAPALCKSGTSDGESYEIESIVLAAEVICSPQQLHRAATMPAKTIGHPVRTKTGFVVNYADDLAGGYQRI